MFRCRLDNVWMRCVSSKCPTFIMDADMETLLIIKALMARGPLSQCSALLPSLNVSSQNYWLSLPPALPWLGISEYYRRMWRKRKKNWKNVDDEDKKWGTKELGFVFFFPPAQIRSYLMTWKKGRLIYVNISLSNGIWVSLVMGQSKERPMKTIPINSLL